MIPRIAIFHWEGEMMSWLRQAAIASFRYHNPDWEVRLAPTRPECRGRYLSPCQMSDWTRWHALCESGGFAFDTDIVFLRPMPAEWLARPLAAVINNDDFRGIRNMGVFGSVPWHVYLREVIDNLRSHAGLSRGDTQCYGMSVLGRHMIDGEFTEIPFEAFYPADWRQAHVYWDAPGPLVPPGAIGVHWYGGSDLSRQLEPAASPRGQRFIERLAAGRPTAHKEAV